MKHSFYLVVGLGKTGQSIARYLQRRHLSFAVFDTRQSLEGLDIGDFQRDFPGVSLFLKTLPETIFSQITEVIASPGVAMDDEVFAEIHRLGIPIIGDIECLAREISVPVVAITGTNGKSTVTTLVGEMAAAAGFTVAVAGNIGLPVLDLLDDERHYDLWVLELSSFQLDLVYSLQPIAATILNISPDHLDRHHQIDAYIAAKQRIYRQANVIIYNRDDKETYPKQGPAEATLHSFGLQQDNDGEWGILEKDQQLFLAKGDVPCIAVNELKLKGQHNWQNVLASLAIGSALGINIERMSSVLRTFSGLPHRCQWVRTLAGVDWINDSKGTNIGATIAAIAGVGSGIEGQIVLIAGGLGKGADFELLQEPVKTYVRAIVLIGRDAQIIEHALAGSVPLKHASSLSEAIGLAKELAVSRDVVLLSPACASQDMFKDFNHRGQLFTELVNAL